jgi:hypothetical protein
MNVDLLEGESYFQNNELLSQEESNIEQEIQEILYFEP